MKKLQWRLASIRRRAMGRLRWRLALMLMTLVLLGAYYWPGDQRQWSLLLLGWLLGIQTILALSALLDWQLARRAAHEYRHLNALTHPNRSDRPPREEF